MKTEAKVGLLFLGTLAAIIAFSYALGVINPFANTEKIHITYNFAGGIEVGSPVRVMGIKVGKITDIQFEPGMKDPSGEEVNLKLTASIDKKALATVREDSKYYINLAGVIGEKYLEITPGKSTAKPVSPGGVYRGEDPPRIDQLISQSYSLAGKILAMVEDNESDVVEMLNRANDLVKNLNRTMNTINGLDKDVNLSRMLRNMDQVVGDVAAITGGLRNEDAKKTIDLLHRLMWRLDDLDKKAIRKFLQEEGIKAKIF
jgi:phospholipid/cholesterol/gamma-HCH transport system substrate-binding protein